MSTNPLHTPDTSPPKKPHPDPFSFFANMPQERESPPSYIEQTEKILLGQDKIHDDTLRILTSNQEILARLSTLAATVISLENILHEQHTRLLRLIVCFLSIFAFIIATAGLANKTDTALIDGVFATLLLLFCAGYGIMVTIALHYHKNKAKKASSR
ncbi:hypothetical protein [Nitratidesulfovibrio liaohensis]|uniref:hypothetical protein n=1 Tax=Nitratidesulfovibrio liaohensis TaxID=2604158 RepID=UPI0014246C94|nr:hypothetical protein [Nitratidesulfovibrio liaohensis]NHZ45829.1 hypothetical protein [Nitratidesulfovibrio liaohensis]